jgi:hypothetical protein
MQEYLADDKASSSEWQPWAKEPSLKPAQSIIGSLLEELIEPQLLVGGVMPGECVYCSGYVRTGIRLKSAASYWPLEPRLGEAFW